MAYKWRKNLACFSTYRVLERDDRLDQFEEELVPLDKSAGKYKVSYMAFYPDDGSPKVKEKAARNIAVKFIRFTIKDYKPKKEETSQTLKKWHGELTNLFKDGDKTLTDIAEVQDEYCKFKDEMED
ncbi:hypothetical protein [Aliikangiella coralliicola]|uniref:Uncharacterized protein n=1 Tax=Aliikangiella coralliicola TaxID=2592383 RepID=A0A545UDN6_9GAMM|nr:hypothetical protein [Aliikangiella coralliicola]TQV87576.1 hypothetical protein FLL46_11940 [Aliikangiella coralliicola]